MQTRERAHCACSVFPFIKKKKHTSFLRHAYCLTFVLDGLGGMRGDVRGVGNLLDAPRLCPCPCPWRCFCPWSIWFVPMITLESLNQSKPNFYTWFLSRKPWPSSKMGIAGHMWPPSLTGGLPPPSKLTYLQFQPIQTKFPHMTFDWNISSEFKKGITGQM